MRIQVCYWADEAKAGLWTLVWSPKDFDQGHWQHTVTRRQSNSVVGVSVAFTPASKAISMWQSCSWVAFSRAQSMVHAAKYPNLEKHKPTEDASCHPFPIVIHWHEPLTPGHKSHRFSPKTRYLCCMNPTAGSFIVNQRLQRHFWTCAVPFPEQCLDFDRWTKRSLWGVLCEVVVKEKTG